MYKLIDISSIMSPIILDFMREWVKMMSNNLGNCHLHTEREQNFWKKKDYASSFFGQLYTFEVLWSIFNVQLLHFHQKGTYVEQLLVTKKTSPVVIL